MRYLKTYTPIVLIVTLVLSAFASALLGIKPASASLTNPLLYPYNQTTSISYNIADINAAWTAYKNARITSNGAQGGLRVLWDDNIGTVSEGMGYGMLFTVIFDEQANFDAMWKYVALHLDSNGLMDWKIDGSGNVTGSGAATDADEDIALALLNACVKVQKGAWPASPNGYNYCTLATNMINAIYNTEIDKPGSQPFAGLNNNIGDELIPGDQWTVASTYPNGIVNLSYFSPGYYTVFGKFTNNLAAWEAVNTRNYAITNLAQSKAGNCSKLVPNWNDYNGNAQIVSWQTNEYGWWSWDAARFAWRIAVDKAWYNTASAQESMNEIGGFFSSVGIANVKGQYRLDGTSVDSYDSAFFNANAAAAIWAAPNPIAVNCGAATATLKSTPQQAYDRLLAINDNVSYYPAAWRLLGLLLLTGNFPNLYELGNNTVTVTPGGPTATRTATATITNTPTITPTNGPSTGLKVQYKAADANASDGQVKAHFIIVNSGTSSVALSGLKIRYYFTDAAPSFTTYCDYANLNCSNVTSSVASMSAVTGADHYLEVGFSAGAGSISAGGSSGEVQTRFNRSDWANLNENDDYSFDATKINFTDWSKVTLYNNGVLVWGTAPGGSPIATATATVTLTTGPVLTSTASSTATRTVTVTTGPTATLTRTPTVTITTPPITLTPTRTPTPTTGVGACSPVTSTITAPFSFDGAGTFCWQSANLGAFINSWNTANVSINGVTITNIYTPASSYPAKIGGFWYVNYNSTVGWGHFEAK